MDLVNEMVFHHQFGSGKITNQTMTRITVEFFKGHEVKKFPYPDVFETFLELNNPVMKQDIQEELRMVHKKQDLERQRREEEMERRREDEHRMMLAEKRATAKTKSSSKKSNKTAAKVKGKD